MKRLPALILDLDGVMYNCPELYEQGVLAREHDWIETKMKSLKIDGKTYKFELDEAGNPAHLADMLEIICGTRDPKSPEGQANLRKFLDEVYRNPENPLPYDKVQPDKALVDAVRAYKKAGGRVVLYSNSYHCYIDEVLKRLGFREGDFDYIQGLDDHPFDCKPDVAGFRKFLKSAGVEWDLRSGYDAVFIDDSAKNIDAGRRAAIRGLVWFNGKGKDWPAAFEPIADSCDERSIMGNLAREVRKLIGPPEFRYQFSWRKDCVPA